MKPENAPDGFRLASRIAAATVHDLNNVAAVVSGHVFLLREGAEPAEEAFHDIEGALETLGQVTASLTALARIGRDEPEQFDVAEIVREAAGEAEVELELEAGLPPLTGRRSDVLAAVKSLLANAREAGPPGSPPRISAALLAAGAGIEITVEDRGPGIPEHLRDRVFDPLFSTRGAKGRGVGLTLSAMVAAMHGGTCAWKPREGGGTRVALRLRSAEDAVSRTRR